jgi:UDP-perosamine 4-acetyltransferase
VTTYVLGNSGHSREIQDLLQIIGYTDIEFVSKDKETSLVPSEYDRLALGVGRPIIRSTIINNWGNHKSQFINLIHPISYISPSASLGRGVTIQFGVVISNKAHIDDGALLNWNATVGHDAKIGKGTVVNPAASISGGCSIGNSVLIGTGARILENLSIGDGAIIGAGAVVTKDVSTGECVIGVPARELKK